MAEPIPFTIPSVDESDIAAVVDVLRSGWLTTGEVAEAFERRLCEYLEIEHVVAVASCTHALEISMHYLDLPRGSRVGVPTWTFVSTALAAVHAGLQPVLLDVDGATLNLSPKSFEAAAASLDVVIPVHFAGNAVSADVFAIADRHRVTVVEDAAHALGTKGSEGLVNGSCGLSACFSFYATKNLTSGEGGAIATADAALAEFARSFRLHGLSRDAWKRYRPDGALLYDIIAPGIKANFPDILAALAGSQLSRFDTLQARRRRVALQYHDRLAEIDGVTPLPEEFDEGGADHLMVIRLDRDVDRARVITQLGSQGVGTSIHFRPLHTFRWMRENVEVGPSGLATADALTHRVLSLPLYPDISPSQVDRVCEVLAKACADAR